MSFDRNDPADLLALKDEVNNDPLGLGYDPAGGTSDILDLLNAKNYTVSKPTIDPSDVKSSTTYAAYDGLAIDEQEWLRWMTDTDVLVVTTDLQTRLAGAGTTSIWGVADRTEMVNAMTALIDVPGSRAEVLFGYGTVISDADWFAGRDS